MPLIEMNVKHGRTPDDARDRLEEAVLILEGKFGLMFRKAEWSPARDSVRLQGPGVRVNLRVDAEHVHVSGDIPLLANLLGTTNLKQIVESAFKKPSP